MWTLDGALILIRTLQPQLHALNFHLALGGGVLNKGFSDKDLDLYVFPFDRAMSPPILPFFEKVWGVSTPLANGAEYPDCEDYPPDPSFDVKVKFATPNGRIDLFISRNGVTGAEE